MRTSDRRHGSVGEMYANQRHMMILGGGNSLFLFFVFLCMGQFGTFARSRATYIFMYSDGEEWLL